MRGESDRARELLRHPITVRRDEADLARREPELHADHRRHGDHEQNSEVQSRHPGNPWVLCENYMFVPACGRERAIVGPLRVSPDPLAPFQTKVAFND
jgi:hypothetical protein